MSGGSATMLKTEISGSQVGMIAGLRLASFEQVGIRSCVVT